MLKAQEKNEVNCLSNDYESSFENISGEEEDEDDLLKSESEENKSSYKNIKKNEDDNSLKNNELITSQNINIDNNKEKNNNNDNNNNFEASIHSSRNSYLKKSEEDQDIKDDIRRRRASDFPSRVYESRKERAKEKEEKDGETESEEEDKQDDEEDNGDEDSEDSVKPYEIYLDSDISYKNIFAGLTKGNYIYGIKSKKYYSFLDVMPYNNNTYLFMKDQADEEEKRKNLNDIINKLIDEKIDKKIIKQKLYKFIRKKAKAEEIIVVKRKNMDEYTFNQKIRMHYLNYLDKKTTFEIQVNINWKLLDFINYIKKLYHIPDITNNKNIAIIIKNKKYSGKDFEKNEKYIFSPKYFDYQKDYIFLIEHENFDIITLDLGYSIDKYNFKRRQVPHILFSSHHNLNVEAILVSKQLKSLECEIYVFRDEFYFNLERNIGKNNYEKAKDALKSYNWKNKCDYITTIKTMKNSDYKNNEDVLSFSIWPRFILKHDKTYIFLVSTPINNINVFDSGVGDQGLFIISGDKRAIINGIICKKLSDFCIDN